MIRSVFPCRYCNAWCCTNTCIFPFLAANDIRFKQNRPSVLTQIPLLVTGKLDWKATKWVRIVEGTTQTTLAWPRGSGYVGRMNFMTALSMLWRSLVDRIVSSYHCNLATLVLLSIFFWGQLGTSDSSKCSITYPLTTCWIWNSPSTAICSIYWISNQFQ